MNLAYFTALLSIGFSAATAAAVPNLVNGIFEENIPSSYCSIHFYVPGASDTFQDYNCSGTIISNNTLLTAGHCVIGMIRDPHQKAMLNCNYKNGTYAWKTEATGFEIHSQYALDHFDSKKEDPADNTFDIGKLHFTRPLNQIEAMKLASSEEQDNLQKNPLDYDCFVNGSGQNEFNQTPLSPRIFRSAKLYLQDQKFHLSTHAKWPEAHTGFEAHYEADLDTSDWLSAITTEFGNLAEPFNQGIVQSLGPTFAFDGSTFLQRTQWTEYLNLLQHYFPQTAFITEGDSGGALACRKKSEPKAKLKIFGVNSAIAYRVTSPTLHPLTKTVQFGDSIPHFSAYDYWIFPNLPTEEYRR